MKHNYELKPLFLERMKELLPDEKDFENYLEIIQKRPLDSIRANTLKISPEKLKKRLEDKGWKIRLPWEKHPEVMIVESALQPGELGRALEHLLGYYYIQELASMLPIIALQPKPDETILDLCAAPGSKTTQIATHIKNKGTIISNDASLKRIKILATNLERCGVTNCIITRKEGAILCKRLLEKEFKINRILLDAPCSGEGTLRSSAKTSLMWNIKNVGALSRLQKRLVSSAIKLLNKDGILVYSTCTHAPEENEEIVDFVLRNFPEMEIEKISLPVKTRAGITRWQNKEYDKRVKYSCRVYPQDNDTEGFFIAKFRKIR